MKILLQFQLCIILLGMFVSSCTTEKRLYMPGYNVEWKKASIPSTLKTDNENINSSAKEEIHDSHNLFLNKSEILSEDNLSASTNNSDILLSNSLNFSKFQNYNPNIQQSEININTYNTDSCDNIILKNGNEISAKVLEIGEQEIKFKKCQNLNGPTVLLNKGDILMIKYSNGTKDIFSSNNSQTKINDRKLEGLGLAGCIISITGFMVAAAVSMLGGIIMAIVGIIFGIISLAKIATNPEKYKGRGNGIASIIIGVFTIGLTLLLISLFL